MASSDSILSLINKNKWNDAIKQTQDLFKNNINFKNLFHYACLRGNKKVIFSIVDLKSVKIFTSSDDTGDTGAHMLANMGFDDILIELVKKEPIFLKLKNFNNMFVWNLISHRMKTFFEIIDVMTKNSMINYLNYENDKYSCLLTKLFVFKSWTEREKQICDFMSSLKEIDWNIPKNNPLLFQMIEIGNEAGSLQLLTLAKNKVINLNINVKDEGKFNVLSASIISGQYNVALFILDMKNCNVDDVGRETSFAPLKLVFAMLVSVLTSVQDSDEIDSFQDQIDLIISVAEKIVNKNPNYNILDAKLNIPLMYALRCVQIYPKILENDRFEKILRIMIINSDLNIQNVRSANATLIIFQLNLWRKYEDILTEKTIDVNVWNKYKENVLTVLSDNETLLGTSFDEDICKLTSMNEKKIKGNKSIEMLDLSNKIILPKVHDSDSFGLFLPDGLNKNLYLAYILNNYDCVVPVQSNVTDKKNFELKKTIISRGSEKHIECIHKYATPMFAFYQYLPCLIIWADKNVFYIVDDFDMYLGRAISSEKRYVIINVSLVTSDSGSFHANIVIYDKIKNTVTRFEPYGDWELADPYNLNLLIIDLFKKGLKLVGRKQKFRFIHSGEFLNKTKFQSASLGDDVYNQNVGDPEGYCLAWCFWFIELKMLNPDLNDKTLVESGLAEIMKGESENQLLNYIRKYGKQLDQEKNKICKQIGLKDEDFYKKFMLVKDYDKIIEYMKNLSETQK